MPVIPAEADPTDHRLTRFVRTFAFGARTVARSFARVRIEGLDRIPGPGGGPLILAPNHASNADPVVVGAWITPILGRRIHWFAKREVLGWPLLGWAGRIGGIHGIERGTADVEGFRTAMKVLETGGVLLMFAEGTRSPTGALKEAKPGLATLAIRSDATIVPIAVCGSHRAWPKGGLPRIGRIIRVRVGQPFRAAEVVPFGTPRRDAKDVVTHELMARIASLLPADQRGAYPSSEVG